jgi:hypothetical protein
MGETTFQTDDAKLIATIQKSVDTKIIPIDGVDFATRNVFPPPAPVLPKALVTHTLQSVIDYLAADATIDSVIPIEPSITRGLAVHVVSPHQVQIVSNLSYRWRAREVYIVAETIDVIGPVFKFGQYYPLEAFIISLRSLFAETDDVDELIKILGRVEDSNVRQYADDGVSQTVTATVGIATKRDVTVPSVVRLTPWRTFPEVEQVESEFFLRLRKGDDDEPPEAALFETDGGKWKIEAIKRIAAFLCDGIVDGVPVIS